MNFPKVFFLFLVIIFSVGDLQAQNRDEAEELRFFGVGKGTEDPLLVSSSIVKARAEVVRKLVAAAKYREAAKELLELRQEIPRKSDFFVNYWLGVNYRNIAESLRDGFMLEDEKGDLYYRDEMERGYKDAAEKESYLISYKKNQPYFSDDDVKRLQEKLKKNPDDDQLPIVTNIRGIYREVATNHIPYLYTVTNKRAEFDIRSNANPDREILLTNWAFATNQTTTPRLEVKTNFSISNYTVVVTNKPPAPTNVKGDLEYIYDFYPDSKDLFNGTRKPLVRTNDLAATNFTYLSNTYAVTNVRITSNAVTSRGYLKPLFPFTILTNRREVTYYTTNEATNVAIVTNRITNMMVITNHLLLAQRTQSDRDALSLRKEYSLRSLKPLSPASMKYYELAIAWLNTLIANDLSEPFQESAVLQKAEIFSDLGESLLSIQTYAFFESKFPRSKRRIDSLIGQGNVFLGGEDLERATSAFGEALRRFPNSDKKDYIKMKLDFIQMAREKAGRGEALITLVQTEIQKDLSRYEAFEAEIKRREGRLREVQFFRSLPHADERF